MSDLTDRMRICAAFIIASEAHEYDNETGRVLRDAAVLLIEASDLLEAPVSGWSDHQAWLKALEIIAGRRQSGTSMSPREIAAAALAVSAEPMEIIPPVEQVGTTPAEISLWLAPGGPLPIVTHGTVSPRACPKCDSRAMKTLRRREGRMMLECPACTHTWEMTTR